MAVGFESESLDREMLSTARSVGVGILKALRL